MTQIPDNMNEMMVEFHHFPTKSQFVRYAMRQLEKIRPLKFSAFATRKDPLIVLDHSAGTCVWGAVTKELFAHRVRMISVEYQVAPPPRLEATDEWYCGYRFQDWANKRLEDNRNDPKKYPLPDVIIGNGPFKELEEFFHVGLQLLKPDGFMWNLVPLNFLATQERTKTLWLPEGPEDIYFVPKRLSFTKDGKSGKAAEYAMIYHEKHAPGKYPKYARAHWDFEWHDDQPDLPEDAVFQSSSPADRSSMADLWEGV